MAKIKEIIQRVDLNKPNDYPEAVKLRWIALLDGKIATSVFLMDIAEARRLAYTHPEDLETEPLVDFPYDDIYDLWLGAKIDFENGEYNKYQNAMEMFNSQYGDFVRWFADTYEPAQGLGYMCRANRYYISAYGLAVKHGFQETEEEWLKSLQGPSIRMRFDTDKIQWSEEDEEVWQDLLDIAQWQGQVVAQTLKTAERAASEAITAKNAVFGLSVSTETLVPGSEATVTKKMENDAMQMIFGIPRGEAGPQGAVGPQGAQGVQGPQGPQGIAGVAVQTVGYVAFNVTDDGILQCTYSGEEAPKLSINSDGHLILEM